MTRERGEGALPHEDAEEEGGLGPLREAVVSGDVKIMSDCMQVGLNGPSEVVLPEGLITRTGSVDRSIQPGIAHTR